MGVLTVHLEKIRHLSDEDGFGKSDPYVMFELEQDNIVFDKGYGKKKSSVKKNDCNPEYGETFTFEDVPSMENMVLHVKVMDQDTGFDDKLGSCKINLEKLGVGEEKLAVDSVIDKKRGKLLSRDAKIYLQISYTE